jgi:hypothetical protein
MGDLTSALVGVEWSASRPCRFTPGKEPPDTHSIRGSVGPRAGLHNLEKTKFLTLPGLKLRPLSRPARSQSLYRLHSPGLGRNIIFRQYTARELYKNIFQGRATNLSPDSQ